MQQVLARVEGKVVDVVDVVDMVAAVDMVNVLDTVYKWWTL
jgi:hypothetical protein